MKGTEKIIAHIQADAQAEADRILAEASEKCDEIRNNYEKLAADSYADKIRAGVKDCEDRADSIGRIAQMDSKKGILALKQEMVAETFEKAKEMILSLPADQYKSLLTDVGVKYC